MISVLIALLVMPGSLLAQTSDPAESIAPTASEAPEAAPPATAKVRFLHGAQAGAMDLYVAEEMALGGLEFGQVSDYVDVLAGKQPLEAVASENDLTEGREAKGDPTGHTGYTDTTAKLKPGSVNTVVLVADGAGLNELWVIKDKPKAGKSMVRIVGLCSNCGPVDFALDKAKKPLAKNLHHLEDVESKYAPVKPGELDLEMRLPGKKASVADFEPITVMPGSSNTVYAVGWVINDTMTAVPTLDAALTDVRVANRALEPHRADIYVDGRKLAKGLLQEQAAPISSILAGDHFVQVVEAGAAVADGTLGEGMVTLEPGATSAIVVSRSKPIYVAPVAADPVKKAKASQMRFTNISSDLPPVDIWIDGELVADDLAFGESTDYFAKVEGEQTGSRLQQPGTYGCRADDGEAEDHLANAEHFGRTWGPGEGQALDDHQAGDR